MISSAVRPAAHPRVAIGRASRNGDRAPPHRSSHPGARGRSQRPGDRDPAADQDQRSVAARRSRDRPDHRRSGVCCWSHPGRIRSEAPSRCLGAPHRSPPLPGRPIATASTALVTASSTARCTPSCSPVCSTTRDPRLRRQTRRRRQNPPRDQALPRTLIARHLFRMLEANGPNSTIAATAAVRAPSESATDPASGTESRQPIPLGDIAEDRRTPHTRRADQVSPPPKPNQRPLDRHRSLLRLAFGVRACLAGQRVRFARDRMGRPALEAKRQGELESELRRLSFIPLIMVDESATSRSTPEPRT